MAFDPRGPPIVRGIRLVSTYQLPDRLRSIFKFELFNAIQSKCFSTVFETDDNFVLSAPTGSGKTVIMELAICRLLTTATDFKIVYQAPTKSLCHERVRDWTDKFITLGLRCAELTGDVEFTHLKSVQSAHIIVTTPEKWDSVTRKWKDNAKLMQMVKLFLVDEVHILNEKRGATLEAVVSRMKSTGSAVRFVALSATVPNSEDIATWLCRNPTAHHLPACREVFDETFRPVKLEKHVIGFNGRPNDFAIDSMLTKEIPALIAQYAKRKPVMIFCISRNSAARTATYLAELWTSTEPHRRLWNAPKQRSNVTDQELQKLVPAGVAFHHGALDTNDRRLIEQAFIRGDINILCSTSTLAVGVNLPCYLVILKGTSCWSDNGLQEYSGLEVMQMLGRAGRPQFESSACALILTQREKVQRYEQIEQKLLESFLHENLIEHLNAEIGIGTIVDVTSAKKWLGSTFLSVRLRQNPNHYRLSGFTTNNADDLLSQICEKDLKLLESAKLITIDQRLSCTEFGDAMARYYVEYETMLVFLKLPPKARMSDILNVLSQAHEFADLKIKSGEKAMFKQINQANDTRYPIKVDIALPWHKVSLILQAQLGGVVLDKTNLKYASQLRQDTRIVINHSNRLIRCIIDIQIYLQDAVAVRNSLELCRSIAAGVWDNTPLQLKQIESIGDVTARKLACAGITSIDALCSTEPQRIEVILGKIRPFGSTLLKKAAKFPNLHVSVKQIGQPKRKSSKGVELQVRCEIGYLNESLPAFFNRRGVYICFLCETSAGKIIDFRRFGASRLQNGEQIHLTVFLKKKCKSIQCHVMCDEIAGTHRSALLKVDIPDGWFPPEQSGVAETSLSIPQGVSSHPSFPEDFDDDALADGDLLAAEIAVSEFNLVDENTSHVSSTRVREENRISNLKRKANATSENEPSNMFSKDYHEPKRLKNGKWTCQHTCNEEGKTCKHKCCKEGVTKPRKRAKIQTSEQKQARSIKDALWSPVSVTKRPGPREVIDIDDILHTPPVGEASTKSRHPKPRDESSAHTIPLVTVVEPRDTGLDSDDLPSIKEIVSTLAPKEAYDKHIAGVLRPNDSNVTGYDTDDVDSSLGDYDWSSTDITPSNHVGLKSSSANRSLSSGHSLKQNRQNTRPERSERVDSRMSLCDVPALLVNSSETVRATTPEIEGHENYDTNEDYDDFLNGVDDADLLALDAHPKLATEATKVSKKTTPDSTAKAAAAEDTGMPSLYQALVEPLVIEMEQQARHHAEEQREKWAKLPAWLYKEYGAYVDII